MSYSLGKVKPNVAAAANYYGPKYGIKTIGGWRAVGSVANSDHPKGLALDFMINNIKGGKAIGDALAADLLSSGSTYGVTYVIWYRRINSLDGRGWRPYHGPVPHTDHVHASFHEGGGTTAPDNGNIVPVSNNNPLIPDSVERIGDFFSFITDPDNLHRLAYYLVGAILIIVGAVMLATGGGAITSAVKVAKKVSPK